MRAQKAQFGIQFALLLLLSAAGLSAQNAPAPAAKPPADPNAFPEAQSQAAANAQASKPKGNAADDNPFPEAQSQAAAKQASADEKADDARANAGSSGDGSTSSSSRDNLKGLDLLGDNDSRISNGSGGVVHNPKLALEDLRVGHQYQAEGNYEGAYGRYKEATQVDPDNADAVFYLAEAARKTTHLDEAASNYKLYLQVEPSGSKAKQARKALAQLEGK